jgi:OmpA-OmpF porin, OOP family
MSMSIRAGLMAAAAAFLLPQVAPAQTMSAEEILRRIQQQREALAKQDQDEPRTRTLRHVGASSPTPRTTRQPPWSRPPPQAPESPTTPSAPAGLALTTETAPNRSQAPVLIPGRATEELPVMEDSMAIDLVVYFEFDSAILKPDAKVQLDALCDALSNDTGSYEIIGHTDAAGSDDYNLSLSKARASEVVRHLVRSCGIDEERLRAHGMGEQRLKDTADPRGPTNRRVEIQVAS